MPCEFDRDIKDTEKKHTSSFGDLQEFFHSIFTVVLIFIHSLCVIVTRSRLLLWIELRERSWVLVGVPPGGGVAGKYGVDRLNLLGALLF
jgi:hypothetical protein